MSGVTPPEGPSLAPSHPSPSPVLSLLLPPRPSFDSLSRLANRSREGGRGWGLSTAPQSPLPFPLNDVLAGHRAASSPSRWGGQAEAATIGGGRIEATTNGSRGAVLREEGGRAASRGVGG